MMRAYYCHIFAYFSCIHSPVAYSQGINRRGHAGFQAGGRSAAGRPVEWSGVLEEAARRAWRAESACQGARHHSLRRQRFGRAQGRRARWQTRVNETVKDWLKTPYRISTTASPAAKGSRRAGKMRENASSNAGFLQLPNPRATDCRPAVGSRGDQDGVVSLYGRIGECGQNIFVFEHRIIVENLLM